MRTIFKDPFSGLSHFAGAILGVFGLVQLVNMSLEVGTWSEAIPFIIFGVTVVLMYASSSVYHLLHVSDDTRKMLRRVDHVMIFFLIAGSYTPYCLIALKQNYGVLILALVWAIAVAGFFIKLFWMHAPRWLSTALYVFMGWISVTAVYPLWETLTPDGFFWLFMGGVFYTVGAVIYALKNPDPFPPHFGFHEIWHLFVLAGTACHFSSISTLI